MGENQNAVSVTSQDRTVEWQFARWLEEMNDELSLIEHDLKGEYADYSNPEAPVWKMSGDKTMNEKGVRYIVGELRSLCNKNVFMSNLEKDTNRVYAILVSYLNTITDTLLYNNREYELDARYLDSVVEKCANFAEFALRRSLYAGERAFMRGTQSVTRLERNESGGGGGGVIGSMFRKVGGGR